MSEICPLTLVKEMLPAVRNSDTTTPTGVSIVIPCLNEAATIVDCVERAILALEAMRVRFGFDGEIIVADNGSTDGSQELARASGARLVEVTKRGYGAALIAGMDSASGDYLVMGDGDCSYDFMEAVPMVESLVQGSDLCIGSRFRGEIKPNAMPWKNRHIGNPILSGILRLFFNTHVSDAHCGLRALTAECFDELRLTSPGMEFASEMVLKASLAGRRITEVPVTLWPDRRDRSSHLRPWRDGWRHLCFMLMLSPAWLFMVPASFIGLLGCALFVALLMHPQGSMLWLAGIPFGDHWMILAAAMMTVAHQLCLFGLAASINGVKERYRRPTPLFTVVLTAAKLEHMLLFGLGLIAISALILGQVVTSWMSNDFGPLEAMRPVIAGTSLFILGLQTCFGGFLFSIIAGNRTSLHEIMETVETGKMTVRGFTKQREPTK